MPAPTSYARVYAALKRHMPKGLPAWEDDASAILRELGVIGWVVARVADRFEAMFEELFPDGAVETLSRWEALFRIPTRLGDSTDTRRTRLTATVGRVAGNTVAQLRTLLAPLFGTVEDDVDFIEVLRSQIDDGLTVTTGAIAAALPTSQSFTKWWPGVVDEYGVHVFLKLSSNPFITAVLTGPDGTRWQIPPTFPGVSPGVAGAWYQTRTVFLGKPAAGTWTLTLDGAATNLVEARLFVSNDVDAAQIYRLFVRRDHGLAGNPDLTESQRILRKTAVAHYKSLVCERLAMVADDAQSLTDRDPVGV
jgi:hypothetical protein